MAVACGEAFFALLLQPPGGRVRAVTANKEDVQLGAAIDERGSANAGAGGVGCLGSSPKSDGGDRGRWCQLLGMGVLFEESFGDDSKTKQKKYGMRLCMNAPTTQAHTFDLIDEFCLNAAPSQVESGTLATALFRCRVCLQQRPETMTRRAPRVAQSRLPRTHVRQ
jgi:hypothetical protein